MESVEKIQMTDRVQKWPLNFKHLVERTSEHSFNGAGQDEAKGDHHRREVGSDNKIQEKEFQ